MNKIINRHAPRPAHRITAVIVTLLFAIVCPAAVVADEFAKLTSEQRGFAERMNTFMDEMEALYFGTITRLNGNNEMRSLDMANQYADHNVWVTRGSVVEKAGRMRVVTHAPTREFQPPTTWSKYFSVDAHPRSPLNGMIHGAIVLEYTEGGGGHIAGFIDLLPGGTSAEDLVFLKKTMDAVYEEYGIDPAEHREISVDGSFLEEGGTGRREPAGVGGSFYGRSGPGDLFPVTEQYFGFMTEFYREFLTAYLSLIANRQDDPFTAADLKAQDHLRRNWLEDRFFSDPFTVKVVPYEIWSLSTLPPVVKF